MNIEDLVIFKSIMKSYHSNKEKVTNSIQMLKRILATESKETSEMLEIYQRYISGEDIDKKTLDKANEQFTDLLKNVGLLGIFALPGGIVAITFLVKLGKKLGIDILPKSYKSWLNIAAFFLYSCAKY